MAIAIAATETPAKWAGITVACGHRKKMKQFAGDGRTG